MFKLISMEMKMIRDILRNAFRFILPILLLLGAFSLGVLVQRGSISFPCFSCKMKPPRFKEVMVQRLSNELKLSESQREKIEALLDKQKQSLDNLKFELIGRFEQIHRNALDGIKAELNDEQKIAFEEKKDTLLPQPSHRHRR